MSIEDPQYGNDAELVAAIGRHDHQAFQVAYRRHAGAAFRLAKRLLIEQALAQDVVQEVFLRLWTTPGRFDPGRGSLHSYLVAECYGRSVDLWRSETSRHRREEDELRRAHEDWYDLELEVWDRAVAAQVRELIGRLPPREREAVELAFLRGHTHRETATLLGEPLGTVKTRIRSALKRMRKELADGGLRES